MIIDYLLSLSDPNHFCWLQATTANNTTSWEVWIFFSLAFRSHPAFANLQLSPSHLALSGGPCLLLISFTLITIRAREIFLTQSWSQQLARNFILNQGKNNLFLRFLLDFLSFLLALSGGFCLLLSSSTLLTHRAREISCSLLTWNHIEIKKGSYNGLF